jgi:hypothetical protein
VDCDDYGARRSERAHVDRAEEQVEPVAQCGEWQSGLLPGYSHRCLDGRQSAAGETEIGRDSGEKVRRDLAVAREGDEVIARQRIRKLERHLVDVAAEPSLPVVAGEGQQVCINSDSHSGHYTGWGRGGPMEKLSGISHRSQSRLDDTYPITYNSQSGVAKCHVRDNGDVAQLGEHHTGSVRVWGSSPHISTII